ncbi:MAG: recombinase RecA [Chloroflexi bacterium]|jgi:recombination protein RecA|nr:recombinase RecA [Chloroflexota bacterium]MBT4073663.1 recombinase RecA [Chloroflexota bacterium]MBT4514040.1 recombinase RecA [Chloroflexota bacterium]MBT5319428.1 recombinase RecA [Chloroflexota bacterium]MBT6681942.1 recombinase RecA [Chloroflexota bacterium]
MCAARAAKAPKPVNVIANGNGSEREKALELALAQIDKAFGRGAIMKLSDQGGQDVDAIPTGSIALDIALGVGGLPRGRVVEIFGAESAGKTTLASHVIAEAQRLGGTAAYIDAEHAMDPAYSKRLGVDIDTLLVSQPDSAEQALEITDYLVRSGALDVIVVDSVAALVPMAEQEGEMGDTHIGLQARLMSQALRKLTGSVARTSTTLIFINQLREKVGVVFGNPEVTPGGRALKFYSSVRIDLRRMEAIKSGTDIIGNRVRARVVKNKVAAPFRVAELEFLFKEGISKEGALLDLGVEHGILTKSGSFFSYGDTRLGQGREASRTFLKREPAIRDEIDSAIRAAVAAKNTPAEPSVESPAAVVSEDSNESEDESNE